MKRNLILFFTATLMITSCEKKETSVFDGESNQGAENEVVIEKEIEEPSVFDAYVDIKIPADDELQLFYTIDEDTNFNETNSKRKKVKGSGDFQTVKFGLPRHATSVRLDLGQNSENKEVTIKNIRFEANGLEYQKAESPLAQFSGNDFVQIDTVSGKIKLTQKDGKFDPFIVSKKNLNDQLQDSLR